jgi:dual specificity MAP kinase phosphatase
MVTKITDGLYLGAIDDIEDIQSEISYIISVCGEISDRADLDKLKGYIIFNLEDVYNYPDLDQRFEEVTRVTAPLIDAWRLNGGVFVHCHVGVSRSPSIILDWMMRRLNKPFVQAFQELEKMRYIDPNPQFYWVLKDLDEKLFPG